MIVTITSEVHCAVKFCICVILYSTEVINLRYVVKEPNWTCYLRKYNEIAKQRPEKQHKFCSV